ncbi:related to Actin-like protein ARP9 [Saccharomycodes ludwigii]|uniref:Related to Actin-like protein ARP9 n=1 Tax=Saccharomycodes ludwigii TaxID=36035 RepID=A0A376B5I0_9ASCO|nr:related to Actin-like protein ARP9 [Saccharomycodes ludwigii]
MAPSFRQETYLIIQPGSTTTLVELITPVNANSNTAGYNNEEPPYPLPTYSIPTEVYYNDIHYSTTKVDATYKKITPIINGEIVDLDSFKFFLKSVFKSVVLHYNSNFDNTPSLTNFPLLLVTNHKWSFLQLETLVQFFMEQIGLNNLMFLPSGAACSSGFGSVANGIVIDIGKHKTDLIPILDYLPIKYLTTSIDIGGADINKNLLKLFADRHPTWSEERVENLKKSNIFEVLLTFNSDDDDGQNHNTNNVMDTNINTFVENEQGSLGKNDEDNIDVAAIVTSDKDTRQILEERERNKNTKKNSELGENTFFDASTNELVIVGEERFKGCGNLIRSISKQVGMVLQQVPDINKRKVMWDNVMIVGNTSSITGFKEAVLRQLIKDYLVQEPASEKAQREKEFYANAANKKKGRYIGHVLSLEYQNQVPTSIKLVKPPEYFPDWKKTGYGEIIFLGAEIVAKQVFGHYNDQFFITRDKYNKYGPPAIWNVIM